MKKLLVDLSALKDLYNGLGQVAWAYGRYFKKYYNPIQSDYQLYLLLPERYFNVFGSQIRYISSDNWFRRHSRYLFPKVEVWHSIHQTSRFKPYSKKTKYILTIHDLNYIYESPSEKARYKSQYRMQRKINRADKLICISKFVKEEVKRFMTLNGKECDVIYNQVPVLDRTIIQKPERDINQPFFFAIGVVWKKKNFHTLLDMMKLMPEKHLYIAGEEHPKARCNDYAQMIKKRIAEERIPNVTLLGGISEAEKTWMYSHCEAVLVPSLLEGFGLPIIEAMQFGKPVFSSSATSLPEIGDKYAFFWNDFKAENMKQLIDENLTKFYENKEFINDQIEYAHSFVTDRHFLEYEKIYSELISQSK